jgi:hypothetical protein
MDSDQENDTCYYTQLNFWWIKHRANFTCAAWKLFSHNSKSINSRFYQTIIFYNSFVENYHKHQWHVYKFWIKNSEAYLTINH